MDDYILKVDNISYSINNNLILDNISFNVNKGECISILGSSGAGKSTLIRCINLLNDYQKGSIYFEGIDIKKDIFKVRTKIGMVFQSFNLFNNLSVLDNCTIGLRKVLHKNKKESEEIAYSYLEKVGMKDYAKKSVNTLSGGQKQRVSIARCLSMMPDIILFDEPTSALDPEMVREVLNVIKEIRNTGITMIIVTHEISFAKDISDRILFVDKGKIIEDDTKEEFFNKPKTDRAKEFLSKIL